MAFHKEEQLDPAAAAAAWAKMIEAARPHLTKYAIVEVPAWSAGWINSGLDVRAGEEVSLFSAGMVWLAKDLGLGVKGDVALWHQIGPGGKIAKSIGATTTFRAEQDGRLRLVTKPPGEWLDPTGRFDPDYPHDGATGGLTVAVLVWPGPARKGLVPGITGPRNGL